jgi:hypothetical protein
MTTLAMLAERFALGLRRDFWEVALPPDKPAKKECRILKSVPS